MCGIGIVPHNVSFTRNEEGKVNSQNRTNYNNKHFVKNLFYIISSSLKKTVPR